MAGGARGEVAKAETGEIGRCGDELASCFTGGKQKHEFANAKDGLVGSGSVFQLWYASSSSLQE